MNDIIVHTCGDQFSNSFGLGVSFTICVLLLLVLCFIPVEFARSVKSFKSGHLSKIEFVFTIILYLYSFFLCVGWLIYFLSFFCSVVIN